mmetsp:Transcript_35032/g.98367  ORF Transcript_35032/g.98367 Transcript_35032/m.98367 type:complete len:266 (-) Transcript_35032:498-1295(-)
MRPRGISCPRPVSPPCRAHAGQDIGGHASRGYGRRGGMQPGCAEAARADQRARGDEAPGEQLPAPRVTTLPRGRHHAGQDEDEEGAEHGPLDRHHRREVREAARKQRYDAEQQGGAGQNLELRPPTDEVPERVAKAQQHLRKRAGQPHDGRQPRRGCERVAGGVAVEYIVSRAQAECEETARSDDGVGHATECKSCGNHAVEHARRRLAAFWQRGRDVRVHCPAELGSALVSDEAVRKQRNQEQDGADCTERARVLCGRAVAPHR